MKRYIYLWIRFKHSRRQSAREGLLYLTVSLTTPRLWQKMDSATPSLEFSLSHWKIYWVSKRERLSAALRRSRTPCSVVIVKFEESRDLRNHRTSGYALWTLIQNSAKIRVFVPSICDPKSAISVLFWT